MEPRQGAVSTPLEEVLSQVSRLIAELQETLLRQQQVLRTLEARLQAVERSPPPPLEAEALDSFDMGDKGAFRHQDSTQGSTEAPRTRAEWRALCARLAQKQTLTEEDFLALVLGHAAEVGTYEFDPWEHYGDVYHVYKLSLQLSPAVYRSLVDRFIESKQGIEFFRRVSVVKPRRRRQRLNPARREVAKQRRNILFLQGP
ncbi:hypothetical protein Emed_004646 [Eimeria media]